MLYLNGHTAETAQLVVACLYDGDPTATAALQAASDACANSATRSYLAELQMHADSWLDDKECAEQAEREGQT